MARSRNIKPGLFKNEILGTADPLYTIVFEGLWILADRSGRLEDRPIRIKAEVIPYRYEADISVILSWLSEKGFIIRYQYGENRYIQIINFAKHQNPHKNEQNSIIPEYTDSCTTTEKIGISTEKIGSAPADSLNLIPDSLNLIPDSPIPEKKDLYQKTPKAQKPNLKTYLDSGIEKFNLSICEEKICEFFDYRQSLPNAKRYKTEKGIDGLLKDVQGCINKNYSPFECIDYAMEHEWLTPSPEYFNNVSLKSKQPLCTQKPKKETKEELDARLKALL